MSKEPLRASDGLHAPEASVSSRSSTPVVVTPPLDPTPFAANGAAQHQQQRRPSPLRVRAESPPARSSSRPTSRDSDIYADGGLKSPDLDDEDPMADHSSYNRVADGKSSDPLLKDERGRQSYESPSGSARPPFHARRSTFRSQSPGHEAENSTKKKYIVAAFFLGVCLVSFVVQTETAVLIQQDLDWTKPYCMLWMTHGSWSLLYPVTFLIMRIGKRRQKFGMFWSRQKHLLRTTAQMVRTQRTQITSEDLAVSPVWHMIKVTTFVTCALTVAGGSWYVAVDLTSSSDLTAIYNCSAFFAYAFSIPLLGDKLRFDKIFSVGLAIIGVLTVVYGDAGKGGEGKEEDATRLMFRAEDNEPSNEPRNRLLGNIMIGIGSILYGLYEVLYKKHACPPESISPYRGTVFAMFFGSMIGTFTVLVLWIPLPILHWTGIETFVWPTGKVAWMLAISTLSNATFSGSFLVLISLTSPVLSSVAALLTIFIVAIFDWLVRHKPLGFLAIIGGVLIIVAFLLLSWSTYRELQEEARKKIEQEGMPDEDEDEDDDVADDEEARYNAVPLSA